MIVKTDKDTITPYLRDQSGLGGGKADRVVLPENERETGECLRSCAEARVPVTVSGAGTGVTGAGVPMGGTVLSTERMNRILSIERMPGGGGRAIVQPGVTLDELDRSARGSGLFYPPDPTERNASIGGTLATNASGSRGLRYGSTRNHVIRLTVTLADGRSLDLRRQDAGRERAGRYVTLPLSSGPLRIEIPPFPLPSVKNAAGYPLSPGMDPLDLFIGHEGTLGVVTEAELALRDLPEATFTGLAFFSSEHGALDFVDRARDRRSEADPVSPAALEYFDAASLCLLSTRHPNIPAAARAAVLFEQDIDSRSGDAVMEAWESLLGSHGCLPEDVWVAVSEHDREGFRGFRHDLPEMLNDMARRNGFPKVGTDMAVPAPRSREMTDLYRRLIGESGIAFYVFGHIGESHLHVNMLPETPGQYEAARELYRVLAGHAVKMGGTVSAEHGIGKLKHPFLLQMLGDSAVRSLAGVKKALDPAAVLGRGTLFPEAVLDAATASLHY